MKNASNILTLPIVELKEGRKKGKASDIVLNPDNRQVYLIVIGKRPARLLLLDAAGIIGIGEDFMLIRDENALHTAETEEDKAVLDRGISLLDIMAVSSGGNRLGRVKDFVLNEEKKVHQLILENGEAVEAEKIVSLSEDYVFIGKEEKLTPAISIEPQVPDRAVKVSSPLGLKVTKQVISADGEFTAEEGSEITEEMLAQADEHGALVELAMYAE